MNLSDIQSPFQLQGCILQKIIVENDFVFIPNNDMLNMSVNLKNNISDIRKNEKENCLEANLVLEVDCIASISDNGTKYSIHLALNGLFSFSGDNQDEFTSMLLLNGNSTLYSIARSQIITISSMSLTSGQLILPLINVVKLFEASKQENKK